MSGDVKLSIRTTYKFWVCIIVDGLTSKLSVRTLFDFTGVDGEVMFRFSSLDRHFQRFILGQ